MLGDVGPNVEYQPRGCLGTNDQPSRPSRGLLGDVWSNVKYKPRLGTFARCLLAVHKANCQQRFLLAVPRGNCSRPTKFTVRRRNCQHFAAFGRPPGAKVLAVRPLNCVFCRTSPANLDSTHPAGSPQGQLPAEFRAGSSPGQLPAVVARPWSPPGWLDTTDFAGSPPGKLAAENPAGSSPPPTATAAHHPPPLRLY